MTMLLVAVSTSAFGQEKGYFGLGVSVVADGFVNPILKTVTVNKVAPNSPAAKAGITAGDLIIEVEGKVVSGLKADELKPFMQRNIGESTRFVLKRANGELRPLSLVAAPRVD